MYFHDMMLYVKRLYVLENKVVDRMLLHSSFKFGKNALSKNMTTWDLQILALTQDKYHVQ